MSNTVWVVVSALGASFLTGLASLGVTWYSHRRTERGAAERRRVAAYKDLLTASLGMSLRASILGFESKSIGGREAYDWIMPDLGALMAAVAGMSLEGAPAAKTLADKLLVQCTTVLSIAASPAPPRSWFKRLRRAKQAWKPPPEWDAELDRLHDLRVRFTELARVDLNQPDLPLLEPRTITGPASDSQPGGERG